MEHPLVTRIARALQVWVIVTLSLALFAVRWLVLRVRRAPAHERGALLQESLIHLAGTLGATFIKAAQYLSTRPDVVPAPMAAALARLQDAAPPFPYREVWRVLWRELGEPPEGLFRELDPYPVASASVAQVHRGLLPDGRVVAVKVLRPDIERLVGVDLWWMRRMAAAVAWLPWLRVLDLRQVVEDLAAALDAQLDLSIEARNNRRFAQAFADDPRVALPDLVDELCSRRVLCMTFVEGTRITDGEWDAEAREELARSGYHMLLRMIFRDGFVHADLHPGNILVQADRRLVLLDVGLVARLPAARRAALLALFSAWMSGQAEALCRCALNLLPGGADRPADPPADMVAEVTELVERYRQVQLSRVRLGEVLGTLLRLMRRHDLRVDPGLTLTIIAMGIVEGVARQLAPDLDLVAEALRLAPELMGAGR